MTVRPSVRAAIDGALASAKLGRGLVSIPPDPAPAQPGSQVTPGRPDYPLPGTPDAAPPPVAKPLPAKKKKKKGKHHVRGGKPWKDWAEGDWVWKFIDDGLYDKDWAPDPEIDYSQTDEDVPSYEVDDPDIDRWTEDDVWDAAVRGARDEALRIGLDPGEFWMIIKAYMKERGLHLAPWERKKRRWPGG